MGSHGISQFYSQNKYSKVRDWNKLQGFSHPSDEIIQIRRDLNHRYVSIENSSTNPVGIAITTFYCSDITPKIDFVMKGGEIRHVGINTIDGPMQFIHFLDIKTGKPVGSPTSFRTDSNSFVLREGTSGWFTQTFYSSSFRS
jgi:hypothetical protein